MKCTTMRVVPYLTGILELLLFAAQVFGQIYHVQEMNTEQIKALDREKTVVILHGVFSKSTARTSRRLRTAISLSGVPRI